MGNAENHLIERLSGADRLRLLAICEPVQLVSSEVLCAPGMPTSHVYFPVDGFISLVTQVDADPSLEVGMVGREGMVGVHVCLGVPTSPLRALVQGRGAAWRIDIERFQEEMARGAGLQREINRYLYVLMAQLATSSVCVRFHQIGPRLARWLLMSQDRAHADSFNVTHEFLAYMLGVRRVGITTAAGVLQRCGLIEYTRGHLKVLDRGGLEAAACSCYATDRQVYSKLLP